MLIALHQIIVGGETRRVLVNPSSIYVASETDGGTMVSTIIGTIRVTETPEQIKAKVEAIEILGWKDYIATTDQDNQRYEDSQSNQS